MVMVMVAVSLLRTLGLRCTLQVLRQCGKGALGSFEVPGLQGFADCRKVGADLATP